MGPPVHPGTLTTWGVYCLVVFLIVLRGSGRGGTLCPFRSCGITLLALPVAFCLALAIGLVTGSEVHQACNCGSSETWPGGNNHFDEDVFFAHAVTLLGLCWLTVTCEAHRLFAVENLTFLGVLGVGLGFSILCWCAVVSPAPGC